MSPWRVWGESQPCAYDRVSADTYNFAPIDATPGPMLRPLGETSFAHRPVDGSMMVMFGV